MTKLAFLAIVLLAAPAAAQVATPVTPATPSTVTVTAQATVAARPDLVLLDFGVVTQAKAAGAAAADNARRSDQVVSGLRKAVSDKGEVRTTSYSVHPNFRYAAETRPGVAPIIDSYTVSNTVQVKVADVNAVGKLIDSALQLGANQVNGLSFLLKDETTSRAEALRLAATKAKNEAATIAGALGLRVVRVLSAGESRPSDHPIMRTEMAAQRMVASDGAPTPVQPGTLDVQATVHLVVEVAPAAR